jgi:hypothetical protein
MGKGVWIMGTEFPRSSRILNVLIVAESYDVQM